MFDTKFHPGLSFYLTIIANFICNLLLFYHYFHRIKSPITPQGRGLLNNAVVRTKKDVNGAYYEDM